MVFNPDLHKFDDQGFIADKATGQRVGLENPVTPQAAHAEFPAWVDVHASQIVDKDGYRSTPRWPQFTVDRVTNAIRVLVKNAEEAAEAARNIEAPIEQPQAGAKN